MTNSKTELKFRCTKHCVLAEAGVENDWADSNNLFLLSKTQNRVFQSSRDQ